VPFFGVPVGTISAVAVVAKRTGAPVLPVVNYRDPVRGRYVVEIHPPLAWKTHEDPDFEIAQNTAHYSEVLEGHIRQYPEQWLWTHRRFKGDLSPLRENEWSSGRSR
jgi:KDO2-lipid IV(A) lauroyltransferase